MKNYVIKIYGNKGYLTPDYSLPIERLNLPMNIQEFTEPAYWKYGILHHDTNRKRIFCDIISYNETESSFVALTSNHASLLHQILEVDFKNISTSKLLQSVKIRQNNSNIQKTQVQDFIYPWKLEPDTSPKPYPKPTPPSEKEIQKQSSPPEHKYSEVFTPKEEFFTKQYKVDTSSLTFGDGQASFNTTFLETEEEILITIKNGFIRNEFDALKKYFVNTIGKYVIVTAHIQTINRKVRSVIATSPEIDLINDNIIETIKIKFIKDGIRILSEKESEKGIIALDELINFVSDGNLTTKTFYNNEIDLLKDLLDITKSKHYKHASYLAEHHAHKTTKLRILLKPIAYLFLLETPIKYLFIWETLKTKEATYVWEFEKTNTDIETHYRVVENTIQEIKAYGKSGYLKQETSNFKRIYHDYSDPVGGFNDWKDQLSIYLGST